MTAASDGGSEADLRVYLRVLRRRAGWVIVCTFLGVGGALGYALSATPQYSATTQLLVQPQNGSVTFNATQPTITPTDVATELQLLGSAPVVDAVEARVHLSKLNVKMAEVGQTDVISVTATHHQPALAAKIANAYGQEFVQYETRLAAQSLTTAETQLSSQIQSIQQELASSTGTSQGTALANQEAVLKEEYAQLQVEGAETTGGVEVISPAAVPTVPSSPKKVEDTLLGLAVGLVVGVGAAFVVDTLDDAIYTKSDLERVLPDVPVMAMVPVVPGWRDRSQTHIASLEDATSPVAEAYRSLRTSLQFASHDTSIGSVLVTSPTATDGKTSTVANLGVVLARVGQKVVLVSADLRRPRLASFFDLDERIGLTSVMLGELSLDDALQPVPDVPGLSVLGCGPRPPDPAEVLSSPKVTRIFDDLAERFDMIVVDSPPLAPVTDALLLRPHTDMTLLIVAAGQTKKGQLHRAWERIRQTGTTRTGIVVNEVKRDTDYGYGYSYAYKAQDPDKRKRVDPSLTLTATSTNGHGDRHADEQADHGLTR